MVTYFVNFPYSYTYTKHKKSHMIFNNFTNFSSFFFLFYAYFNILANGYGRSESTVVFFLQRAENAKRNYGSLIFCDTLYYGLNSSTILDYGENILKDSLQIIYNRNNGFEISSKICFMELTGCGVQVNRKKKQKLIN